MHYKRTIKHRKLREKAYVLFIRTEGLMGKITDIENTVVKNLEDGTPILIKILEPYNTEKPSDTAQ